MIDIIIDGKLYSVQNVRELNLKAKENGYIRYVVLSNDGVRLTQEDICSGEYKNVKIEKSYFKCRACNETMNTYGQFNTHKLKTNHIIDAIIPGKE